MQVVNLPVDRWPLGRRHHHVRLAMLTIIVVAGALTLWPVWDSQPFLSLANWLVVVLFATAAFLLAEEDKQVGNAALFLSAAGCKMLLNAGGAFPIGPLPVLAWVIGPLLFPITAVVSLRYPDQRLASRARRTMCPTGAGGRPSWTASRPALSSG
jgi:hypothetical protein